ncbi:MAG: NAD(P)H-dependent oxidoreductase [Flavobacteriaceae bacterium]
MDSIIHDLQWRYAVKKFDGEKLLPPKKIELLKEAFNLTATSYGLQPISLVIVQDKALQQKLVAHSFGQQQVAQASHLLIFCIRTDVDSDYITRYFDKVGEIRGTQEEVLAPFKNELIHNFQEKKAEDINRWAINQAYLAMGNLLTVCAIEKIDACPMEGIQPNAYDHVLGLSGKNLQSVLAMPIGHRALDDMFADFKKVRKPMEESIIEFKDLTP